MTRMAVAEFTDEEREEYERRLAEADEHPERLMTYDELKARLTQAS